MSLINKMLKDLEKRRSQDMEYAGTPLQGVNQYAAVAAGSNWLWYLALSLILVLAIAVGLLLWERYTPLAQDEAAATAAALQNGSATQTEVVTEAATKAVPQQQTDKSPQPKAASQPQAARPVRQKSPAVATATVKKPQAKTNASARVENDSPVIKRARALTAGQQAEKGYRKAYRLLSEGRMEEAETVLRQALRHYPRHSRARELLAGSYIKAGRYVEAGEILQQGLLLQPRHGMFAKLYARVLLQQNNVNEAVSLLRKYAPPIEADPDYHVLLAALYQRQNNFQAAAETYERLLKRKPQNGVWWLGLGISREKLGQNQLASEAYKKAREDGSLNARLRQYTDNRLAALREIDYPGE